jgi:hypothetical protein
MQTVEVAAKHPRADESQSRLSAIRGTGTVFSTCLSTTMGIYSKHATPQRVPLVQSSKNNPERRCNFFKLALVEWEFFGLCGQSMEECLAFHLTWAGCRGVHVQFRRHQHHHEHLRQCIIKIRDQRMKKFVVIGDCLAPLPCKCMPHGTMLTTQPRLRTY